MSTLSNDKKIANGTKADTATKSPRQAALITRKKLPWLDGPQHSKPGHVPGHFRDSNESVNGGDAAASAIPQETDNAATGFSTQDNPTLRSTGSTPSLSKRPALAEFKRLSLSSQKPMAANTWMARRETDEGIEATERRARSREYASSAYSVSPAGMSQEPSPTTIPKAPRVHPKRTSHRRALKQGSEPKWPTQPRNHRRFTSQTDLPLDPTISPRQKVRPHRRQSESCRSCEEQALQHDLPMLRQMPKSKTMPYTFTAASPSGYRVSNNSPPALARKSTLFSMPNHLVMSSSSSMHSPRVSTSLPHHQFDHASSPFPPRRSSAQNDRQLSQSLTRAVTGLENLLEEAMVVARDAAKSGRNDEVATILDDATSALRRASVVHSQMHTGHANQPLVLSPVGSERGSENSDSQSLDTDTSSVRSRSPSNETVPTVVTKSAHSSRQPMIVEKRTTNGKILRPSRATLHHTRKQSSSEESLAQTPPRLYQPHSADSIVRDFAYTKAKIARAEAARRLSRSAGWGTAADYYGDNGQSVATQPGVRPSINPPMITDDDIPHLPRPVHKRPHKSQAHRRRSATEYLPPDKSHGEATMQRFDAIPTEFAGPPRQNSNGFKKANAHTRILRDRHERRHHHPHLSHLFESPYYRSGRSHSIDQDKGTLRGLSTATDTRYDRETDIERKDTASENSTRYSEQSTTLNRNVSLKHPRRKHISLQEGQGFSLGRYHRRQPIAREWSTSRKRITAAIACANTVFIGLIAGIYAGEVPRMQYQLADTTHKVILGNVLLFACLGVTTLVFWPLPLLHGRKPYTLLSFALILPLLFPQAIAVTGYHPPNNPLYRCGLLIPRVFKGIALGFANINFLPTLFDLFGASLMSEKPHQEIVVYDDVRRQGGGLGVWLGIWSFCFGGSMSIGFCIGAVIISALDPSWGFYLIVILLAVFLLVNVIAPETRRSPYRRSIAQFLDREDNIKRRVARGEIKLHISNEGPKFWFQEVWAGLILTKRMVYQTGFFILTLYLGWLYAQVTLVILLLGALLSRDYKWQPQYVGAASLAMAVGAFLAVPLSKANLFSRARDTPQRTDSMTMQHGRVTWSSHMLRRCLFSLTLPFAALAYTLTSPGPSIHWAAPTVFCGLVGFLSNLAIAECVGLIMETFDTCDLQPGVNSKHRLQSLAETTRRRRTNYSSFPRVCAGFFAAQSLGFMLSAAATGVSGDVTRAVGAQISTAIVAAILLVLTVLFIAVLWRWKEVQVVPNNPFGEESKDGIIWGPAADDPEWKPVIIGNPSGKMRRVNVLELGALSRWTEIRRLNKLVYA